MIKRLFTCLIQSPNKAQRQELYQAAAIEANRILDENKNPKINIPQNSSEYPFRFHREVEFNQIMAIMRHHRVWLNGFIQAIYDKLSGKPFKASITYGTSISDFIRVFYYAPLNYTYSNEIWNLGYSSYVLYVTDGILPF